MHSFALYEDLAGIEAVLGQHPGIREAVVVMREDLLGDNRLIAYLLAASEGALDTSELRSLLAEKLPAYKMPAAFVTLDALPLTDNGKVDRKALPRPDLGRLENEQTFVPPRDALELQLANIWESVLAIPKIGVKDNFFELGGHSLLSLRMLAEMGQRIGRPLPASTLFHFPTIEQLASILRRDGWSPPWTSLVPLQSIGSRPPFFCMHGASGDIVAYRELARHLCPDQPVYGLQAQVLNGKEPHTTMEEMAAHYVREIRMLQPDGPYFLGGRSFGGMLALETAQQLVGQGCEVALLVLFDTFRGDLGRPLPVWRRIPVHLSNLARRNPRQKIIYIAQKARVSHSNPTTAVRWKTSSGILRPA